jgi:hypothetical protein
VSTWQLGHAKASGLIADPQFAQSISSANGLLPYFIWSHEHSRIAGRLLPGLLQAQAARQPRNGGTK